MLDWIKSTEGNMNVVGRLDGDIISTDGYTVIVLECPCP